MNNENKKSSDSKISENKIEKKDDDKNLKSNKKNKIIIGITSLLVLGLIIFGIVSSNKNTKSSNTAGKEDEVKIDNSKNQKLYVLSHFYYTGKDKIKEKHRILSVCSSKLEARKKIKEYQKIEGFSSHISNFYIEEYILDKEIKKEGEL